MILFINIKTNHGVKMCLVPLNPVLNLFEWPQVPGQWPVLHMEMPPLTWRALATLVPTEQVTGFSSNPWASERGRLWLYTPTCPYFLWVSGLFLPLEPPASSDENLDREAEFIDLDAFSQHMSGGLIYMPGPGGRQAA